MNATVNPFEEPRTEDEAEQLQRFLEQGADVRLETVKEFRAEPISLRVPEPAVLKLPPVGDLSGVMEEAGGNDVLVTLEFSEESLVPDLVVEIFMNTVEANADTPTEDPGFLGSVAFFCHGEERDGVFVCLVHGDEPVRYRIPLSEEFKRQSLGDAPTLTLVPLPIHAAATPQTLLVAASIDIVRSTVAETG